ncbi:MAG: ATP-grasp domain-containing protein [Bacteroidales bacterium]|nr:ATP-grasp domain-containing protein [Bacteroidales bacterium]
MKLKLAIIGASRGQYQLCLRARQLGIETYCFAWPQNAVCKDIVDHFIPISITEKDKIVEYCKAIRVNGVVSNASELTNDVVSYVSEKLGLIGNKYCNLKKIQNKSFVREITSDLEGLKNIESKKGSISELFGSFPRPFVIKPISGGGKKGVNYIDYNTKLSDLDNLDNFDPEKDLFLAEEYIGGKEYSIECLSYRNSHQVIQITEKDSSGPPHFVEMAHHQPAIIPESMQRKITSLVPELLKRIGFENGASHIEIKITDADEIYLIEVNPRGGGDNISNVLVSLSTDFDYIKAIIEVALGIYQRPSTINNSAFCGIYMLNLQSAHLIKYFQDSYDWMYYKTDLSLPIKEAKSNWDNQQYFIYKSDHKIEL